MVRLCGSAIPEMQTTPSALIFVLDHTWVSLFLEDHWDPFELLL